VYEFAGPAALVVVGLWIAYLVPHKLRHRQQLLESRTDDRFSDALRVLAVTGPEGSGRRRRAEVAGGVRQDCGPVEKRAGLLTPGTGSRLATTERGGAEVDRPHGTQDRIGADAARRAAQLQAAHAAATARRGAAARRRGALAGVLLAATVVGWVVAGVTALGVLAGVVPTVLLAGVLGLGRRAVVQGRLAEDEWQRRIDEATAPLRERAARPGRQGAAGRAVHPSLTETQAIERVRADAPVRTSTRVRDGGRGRLLDARRRAAADLHHQGPRAAPRARPAGRGRGLDARRAGPPHDRDAGRAGGDRLRRRGAGRRGDGDGRLGAGRGRSAGSARRARGGDPGRRARARRSDPRPRPRHDGARVRGAVRLDRPERRPRPPPGGRRVGPRPAVS
jgi:hypothetical protein